MYASDSAEPENARLEDGKLKFYYREFTLSQKIYRKIASFIRLRSHSGSWLLNRITRSPKIKKVLVKNGMKEKDKPIVNSETKVEGDFKLIDKMIYLRFKETVEKDGSIFIMMNCMSKWKDKQREFLDENNILNFYIDPTKICKGLGDLLKNEDITRGNYQLDQESHRFGYKQNIFVAEEIVQFLKRNKLLSIF